MLYGRAAQERAVDFEMIRDDLGVDLPDDYKELTRRYSAIEIGGFLRIYSPVPGREGGYCEELREDLAILQDLCEADEEGELSGGYVPFPAAGGLIPWGSSLSGDSFYWKAVNSEGFGWPVVVGTRNGDWWEYQGGLIDFVCGLVEGTIESSGIPSAVLMGNPEVHVLAD